MEEIDMKSYEQYKSEMDEYDSKYKEVMDEIVGLTGWILEEDLKDAVKYAKGYYKNNKGQYLFIKGIEVTNDTGNLCRMGYNGEDRGVWIHYAFIDEHQIMNNDIPIGMFMFYTNPRCVDDEHVFTPTTKEEFEKKFRQLCWTLHIDADSQLASSDYREFAEEFYKLGLEHRK